MKNYIFLAFTYLLTLTSINAAELNKTSRSDELFPQEVPSLHIEPYIPENYKLQILGNIEQIGFFWAPDNVVEKMLEDEKSWHPPIIHIVKLSGIHSKADLKDFLDGYKKLYPKGFQTEQIYWGSHEVAIVNGYFGTQDISCLAFVRLEDPSGTFFMFQLVYPKKLDFGNGNKPSKEDLKFWKTFLNKTH